MPNHQGQAVIVQEGEGESHRMLRSWHQHESQEDRMRTHQMRALVETISDIFKLALYDRNLSMTTPAIRFPGMLACAQGAARNTTQGGGSKRKPWMKPEPCNNQSTPVEDSRSREPHHQHANPASIDLIVGVLETLHDLLQDRDPRKEGPLTAPIHNHNYQERRY